MKLYTATFRKPREKMLHNFQPFGNFLNASTEMKQNFLAFLFPLVTCPLLIGHVHKIKLSI
jgi:hypothetical protein